MHRQLIIVPIVLLQLAVYGPGTDAKPRLKRQLARGVECLKDVGYYRRPVRPDIDIYDPIALCSEFFDCTEAGTVKYDCGKTRRFNLFTGQCDYRKNVNESNCATTSKTAKPLLTKAGCANGQLGCANKQCIPMEKFCDGTPDCQDGSDEVYCKIVEDPNTAPVCDENACKLPNCFCSTSGTKVPGDLDPKTVPQMILLSFDDAVNSNVEPIYEALFTTTRKNPNGCPIRATFYLSHQWTDYRLVQRMYKNGHDFGLHSTSHRRPESYWDTGDIIKTYTNEFITNRKIAKEFAQFPDEGYFKGMRVPWLKLGGNRQFEFMRANGIQWDHTVSAPPGPIKYWPYTLDYRMPHKCYSSNEQSCPTRKFPGSWVFVVNQINGTITDLNNPSHGEYYCSMMETCPSRNYDDMMTLLRNNFLAHYNSNRAPLGLFFHARWFIDEGHFPALQDFTQEVLTNYTDVYFVTVNQAMNWIQKPTAVGQKLDAFACPDRTDVPEVCDEAAAPCGELPPINGQSPNGNFFTCRAGTKRCPQFYPWIGNWQGEANTYEAGVVKSTTLPGGGDVAPAPAPPVVVVAPAPPKPTAKPAG